MRGINLTRVVVDVISTKLAAILEVEGGRSLSEGGRVNLLLPREHTARRQSKLTSQSYKEKEAR